MAEGTPRHPLWRFAKRVLNNFLKNRGVLLAGGVGYNALLSAIPMFALIVVLLSWVIEEPHLLETIAIELVLVVPQHADALLRVVRTFLASRDVIGVVGTVALLIFSALAFRMLEEAMAVIFHHSNRHAPRKFWVSVLLPYAFILVMTFGLGIATVVTAVVESFGQGSVDLLGWRVPLEAISRALLYGLGFVGMALLFTGIYKVLPAVQVRFRRALIGGFVAALLWEIVGAFLGYYFANLSFVNIMYGSFATVIVLLLGMEAVSIILLLGAQVIAELQASAAAGVAWYEVPPAVAEDPGSDVAEAEVEPVAPAPQPQNPHAASG